MGNAPRFTFYGVTASSFLFLAPKGGFYSKRELELSSWRHERTLTNRPISFCYSIGQGCVACLDCVRYGVGCAPRDPIYIDGLASMVEIWPHGGIGLMMSSRDTELLGGGLRKVILGSSALKGSIPVSTHCCI